MASDEPRDPGTPEPAEDDNALTHPVEPPSRVRRPRGERHLTRRVIAPAALLLVSVPVVAVLFLNLRAVTDRTDSSPASAGTIPTASPSASSSPDASSPSPSETPSETPSESPPSDAPSDAPGTEPSDDSSPLLTPLAPSPAPRVASISATSGPAAGGQVVLIRGRNLDPITQVLFGPITAGDLEHVSATRIRLTTPAGPLGRATVTAKAGADDVRSAPLTYTYQ